MTNLALNKWASSYMKKIFHTLPRVFSAAAASDTGTTVADLQAS